MGTYTKRGMIAIIELALKWYQEECKRLGEPQDISRVTSYHEDGAMIITTVNGQNFTLEIKDPYYSL